MIREKFKMKKRKCEKETWKKLKFKLREENEDWES